MSAVSLNQPPIKSNSPPVTAFPHNVTDPTLLDSVAGFINEVVPTSYNGVTETQDQIQWAHFETINPQESSFLSPFDDEKASPPSLILVLGYTSGVQVWCVSSNGEGIELLNWKHGSVQVLRLLPAPYIVGKSLQDQFSSKRPLVAICDTVTPGPQFCALNFLSLKTGEQVKQIKFKNPILDVLANQRSVVVTFTEKIAIFDAFTLEDRMTVTTCYMCPGIYSNPIALGTRWLAYAEKKLILNKRSGGGNESEGVQSYTATVLHAAKSLGRGLRELGETVASSLTRNTAYKSGSNSPNSSQSELLQKGVITILDIDKTSTEKLTKNNIHPETVVAHFAAHTEAIVCLKFDPSGMLLLTADKRGHDFHLFRIHPHPGGPAPASVHHLYILHRGDTTARVQDMSFSADSRWVTVSTLRGTTHVFPVTPYGGSVCVRTHATPHVVNRLSRFHRSAGLTGDGRSASPVLAQSETPIATGFTYNNPRLPPYPHPTVVHPHAQIRQLYTSGGGSNSNSRGHTGRQRNSSTSSDDSQVVTRVSACFAPPRTWIDITTQTCDLSLGKHQSKPVESIFIINGHGSLIQYDLDPHHASNVPKEKVCGDTPIELTVSARLQWFLQRQVGSCETQLPLTPESLKVLLPEVKKETQVISDDRWLSQVEIITHAGPHRRLWMGPQFTFKTYTTSTGGGYCSEPVSLEPKDKYRAVAFRSAVDVATKPMNVPTVKAVPSAAPHPPITTIEAGSLSSCEQSPKFQEGGRDVVGEVQLREDLAEAMLESPGGTGGRCVIVTMKPHTVVAKVVNPLGTVVTVPTDDDDDDAVGVVNEDEVVIHENCDETLFRPIVTPNVFVYEDRKGKEKKRQKKRIFEGDKKLDEFSDDVVDTADRQELYSVDQLSVIEIVDEVKFADDDQENNPVMELKETLSSSEEEKQPVVRKTRKPKPKLGVRIGKKEEEKAVVADPQEQTFVSTRSWSSIVASKAEEDVEPALMDLSEFMCGSLKADKSSDEEKLSNNTETTESDDSSKWPLGNAKIEDVNLESVVDDSAAKPTKKKSRKKKK